MTAKGKKQNIVINTKVLNKHLSKRKWTYYRLEKETGLPKQTIYRIANTGSISYMNLLIVSQALGITTDELTKGAELPDNYESYELIQQYKNSRSALKEYLKNRTFRKKYSELTGREYENVPNDWFEYHFVQIEKAVHEAVQ